MVILHVIDVFNPEGNGVAAAVKNYLINETKIENVALLNLNKPINLEDNTIRVFQKKDYETIERLPEPFNKPDLVIFNEVYKKRYLKLYKECTKNKIKYIIIPHGCLTKKAQKRKLLKKKLGNLFLFNKFIKKADAIQFLNKEEKNKTNFKYNRYIICGNGITPQKGIVNYSNKNIVYIGRYAISIKGLDYLLKVAKMNKKWFLDNNIQIQLFGRDSCGDYYTLKKKIKKDNLDNIVILNGAIYGKEKEIILKKAYAFIQLSRSEGQPMGIIEALSYGVPCIVTKGTNFGEYIVQKKCGYLVEYDVTSIFAAIKNIINKTQERNEMAQNAAVNSNQDYSWDKIIKETISQYEKICN